MTRSLSEDANWPDASGWLAGEAAPETIGRLVVVGAPLCLGSITRGRSDLAPAAVREALRKFSTYDIEMDTDLCLLEARDLGDLPIAEAKPENAIEPVRHAVMQALRDAEAVVLLGGDNSVTRPGCHGITDSLGSCGLLTLDAHLDLRDIHAGLSNGNPVRALLADGLPGRNVVQIGIQAFANSNHYARVACGAGIRIITLDSVRKRGIERTMKEALDYLAQRASGIYVNVDLDVLDRIAAPASPGSRPGGLAPWELRRAAWLCGFHPKVRAMDLVEVDPLRDVAQTTLFTTAACLLSFASGLINRLMRRNDSQHKGTGHL